MPTFRSMLSGFAGSGDTLQRLLGSMTTSDNALETWHNFTSAIHDPDAIDPLNTRSKDMDIFVAIAAALVMLGLIFIALSVLSSSQLEDMSGTLPV